MAERERKKALSKEVRAAAPAAPAATGGQAGRQAAAGRRPWRRAPLGARPSRWLCTPATARLRLPACPPQEKAELKRQREEQEAPFKYCTVDGRREMVRRAAAGQGHEARVCRRGWRGLVWPGAAHPPNCPLALQPLARWPTHPVALLLLAPPVLPWPSWATSE